MFESDETVRRKVRERAAGLSREEVEARKEEALRTCDKSVPAYCVELSMQREWLEQNALEWQRVLDEMTARELSVYRPVDENV
ncbi:hypothetical protein ACFY2H_42105 [Streptomyces griseofuscus]|uniref:hypothetical protein n=1 Tax=Streptomyces TaxID=1883 RepID=UPI00118802B6|nr:hypothetical protein [Streptomyces murinus]MBA9047262.1 hypothetical protein [Streptomyces murinus]BBC94533.1 hypothetical protein SRO_3357 [Streptomyces rochei]